ncbi:MAG TPA: glycosyl hydrolase family 8 [Candidatus Paceibacterota bacterium]
MNPKPLKKEILGVALIGLGVLIFAGVLYLHSINPGAKEPFSKSEMLGYIWKNYKEEYVEKDTYRTLDRQQNDITTSEGQAYTMLRAVWMDDKQTFDGAFKWANDNLGRSSDNLYSWLFGKRADGTFGVLDDRGGENTASDADADIALALIFAYNRWGDQNYLTSAQAIIDDIWDFEVVSVKGIPYMAANDLERLSKEKIIVNPSYLSPGAYRIFAKYDTDHDWLAVVDSSYNLLTSVTQNRLDTQTSAAIPPDWVVISRETGNAIDSGNANLSTNFGYEALRVPWRIALDYTWFKDDAPKIYLSRLGFLASEWREKGRLASVYKHDGSPVAVDQVPAMYAGTLGYFMIQQPDLAKEIYEQKLLFLFDLDTNDWKTRLSYYDDNIVWFGMALYNDLSPNLDQK